MLTDFNDEELQAQSKADRVGSFVSGLLLPNLRVGKICDQLGYEYRERVYTPMVTVWLFITQVLSHDHSCQQTVNRFNAYRVLNGLPKVATKTTAYCKARCRLPEKLFSNPERERTRAFLSRVL